MRIAYIMRYWPVYGGGETITATLANELVARGHEVHILYAYRNDCNPMPYQLDSKIIECRLHTIEHYSPNDVNALHKYLNDNSIDVMVNQWGSTDLCNEAKKSTQTKLITCWHLDVVQKQNPSSTKQRVIKRILGEKLFQRYRIRMQLKNHQNNYNKSDRYIFLSESFEQNYRLLSKVNDQANKLGSIPNPLTYNFTYNQSELPNKKKQVLFVGRIFEYHKRISYALKVWKNIESDPNYNDWNFKIVGDGPDMLATQNLAKVLELKRVSFEGYKNPRPFYDESSVFVMTSAFEGFGMTLVEAQQYACVPIVMDSYMSLHDIIKNKKNGIIIDNNDIDAYTSELKKLKSNTTQRQNLASSGLDTCTKFKVHSIVDCWEKLFGQITA